MAPQQSNSGSLDAVQVLRRSRRCFVYGCIGLVPVLGVGVACQALQLRNQVIRQLGEEPGNPTVPSYAGAGLLLLWGTDWMFGLVGDVVGFLLLLALQTYRVLRNLSGNKSHCLRGRRELNLGAALAYAGLSMSLWMMGLLL